MANNASKRPKSDDSDDESLLSRLRSTIAYGTGALEHAIRVFSDELLDPGCRPNPDRASELALLLHKVSQVMAEYRKSEAAEFASIKRISAKTFSIWIKAQSPAFRERLQREIAAIDATERRSVLG